MRKLRRTLIGEGVTEVFVLQAVYTLAIARELKGTWATHVTDFFYSCDQGAGSQSVILVLSKEFECNFPSCGREVKQAVVVGDLSMSLFFCHTTIQKINKVQFEGNRTSSTKTAHERLTETDHENGTGSLLQVAVSDCSTQGKKQRSQRHCLQKKPAKFIIKASERRILFLKASTSWQVGDIVIGSICDASRADDDRENWRAVQELRRGVRGSRVTSVQKESWRVRSRLMGERSGRENSAQSRMCGRGGVAGVASLTSQKVCVGSTGRRSPQGLENGPRALRRQAERRQKVQKSGGRK